MFLSLENSSYPSILYGNIIKNMPGGKMMIDKGFKGQDITFLHFFIGTLNHSSAFIRRALFEKYGFYDESFRIVSDWKWYMQAIVFGDEKPVYVNIDMTLFDMTGISETNKDLCQIERERVLNELVPSSILADYNEWARPIQRLKRLRRHTWAYKMVWFIERCLFKWEKWKRYSA